MTDLDIDFVRAQSPAFAEPSLQRTHEGRLLGPLLGPATAAALAPHGIMAGGGHFYAVRPLEALGIDPEHGVLRLGFVHYTQPAEIDRAIAALDAVL